MSGIIDFHSHILPGIDDGSTSAAESVAMLRMEAEQGITHVVATPHFYAQHDTPERFLARRQEAEICLREAMSGSETLPQIHMGAEVYYFSGISDCDALPELTIKKNSYILIEMPPVPWTERMYRELEEIYLRRGIMPIIAHVDRYIGPFRTYGIPERLEELPVLIQANAGFFLRRGSRRTALQMLRKEQIHLLGSDCHNLTTRAPNLGKAVRMIDKCLGSEAISTIASFQTQVLTNGH